MESEVIGKTIHGDIEVTTKYACTICGEGMPQPTVSMPIEDCGVSICLTCLGWFSAKLRTFSRDLFIKSLREFPRTKDPQ